MLVAVINIILLVFAYTYLRELQSCACVQTLYTTRLQNIEMLYILFALFALLVVFSPPLALIGFIASRLSKAVMLGCAAVFAVTICVLYIYFSYNTYKFVQTTPLSCVCAQKWPRFYVYLQSLLPFVVILLLIVIAVAATFFHVPFLTALLTVFNKIKTTVGSKSVSGSDGPSLPRALSSLPRASTSLKRASLPRALSSLKRASTSLKRASSRT